MINKRAYRTQDDVEVKMCSLHVLDLWSEYMEIHPNYLDAAYQDVLSDIPQKVRYCFTENLPLLRIPFVIKNKNDPNYFPQWLVAFEVEGGDAKLVISKKYRSIEGVLFEKELAEILEKVDWSVHAEEVLKYESYDHFGNG